MAFADSGASGLILDNGRPHPGTVTLADCCARGDVLGYSLGWKRALATVGSVIQGRLVALTSGKTGDVIPISANPIVSGRYSGGTAGGLIYVAEGTSNGQVTDTVPSTQNDATTPVGILLSADTVQFFLLSRADSLAA
jgi:hypothetical protein